MTTKKKLFAAIFSLAMVFVVAGTAIGLTLAALQGQVGSGFTISYTAKNVKVGIFGTSNIGAKYSLTSANEYPGGTQNSNGTYTYTSTSRIQENVLMSGSQNYIDFTETDTGSKKFNDTSFNFESSDFNLLPAYSTFKEYYNSGIPRPWYTSDITDYFENENPNLYTEDLSVGTIQEIYIDFDYFFFNFNEDDLSLSLNIGGDVLEKANVSFSTDGGKTFQNQFPSNIIVTPFGNSFGFEPTNASELFYFASLVFDDTTREVYENAVDMYLTDNSLKDAVKYLVNELNGWSAIEDVQATLTVSILFHAWNTLSKENFTNKEYYMNIYDECIALQNNIICAMLNYYELCTWVTVRVTLPSVAESIEELSGSFNFTLEPANN